MTHARISAVDAVLPKKVLTNADLEKMVDTSDEWIVQRTGIKQRHVLGKDEKAIDLFVQVAENLIQKSGLSAADIDGIIVSSSSAPYSMPSTAAVVQGRLGIANCVAFDMQAACSGFVYGLVMANSLICSGVSRRILMLAGDALSKIVDWTDRTTCVLFGDGFGGALVETGDDPTVGIIDYDIGCDGMSEGMLGIEWGVGQGYDQLTEKNGCIYMNGREVYKCSVRCFSESVTKILDRNPSYASRLKMVVPHQANKRILEAVSNKVGIELEKFALTLDQHGNTSSGSIPLALNEMLKRGIVEPGDVILLCGFGAGFTWASVLVQL